MIRHQNLIYYLYLAIHFCFLTLLLRIKTCVVQCGGIWYAGQDNIEIDGTFHYFRSTAFLPFSHLFLPQWLLTLFNLLLSHVIYDLSIFSLSSMAIFIHALY